MGELQGLYDFLFSQCKKSHDMPTENWEGQLTKASSRAIGKSVRFGMGTKRVRVT